MLVMPLNQQFFTKLNAEFIDDAGFKPEKLIAEGGEPLRDEFRRAQAGEEIYLLSYSPQQHNNPYKETGPIFISANVSVKAPFNVSELINEGGSTPYLSDSFVVKAYSEDERILGAEIVAKSQALTKADEFFSNPKVAYVQFRFAAYGCFAAKITR